MNINFNVLNGYMKTAEIGSQNGIRETENVQKSGRPAVKLDTVSISPEAASFREINGSTKAVAAEVNGSAPKERINSLKAQIAAGTYNVSAGDVADAILSRLSF